jgi:hypothetical protein
MTKKIPLNEGYKPKGISKGPKLVPPSSPRDGTGKAGYQPNTGKLNPIKVVPPPKKP